MNELFETTEKRNRSSRRWIYVIITTAVLAVLILLPGVQTVSLSLVVDGREPVEMNLRIPEDCQLEMVYLRSNENVPKTGKLFTLHINNEKFVIEDIEKLPAVKVQAEAGWAHHNAPIDWNRFKGQNRFVIYCSEVSEVVKRYDLELVFRMRGAKDTVEKWEKFVQLRSRNDWFNMPTPTVSEKTSAVPASQK